jgi:D-tyrosyl-tRNA(Tyr) deacylase
VEGDVVSSIGPGLLLLVGVGRGDPRSDAEALAEKVANLRIFADADGKMNLALADVGGEALVVSQFTLYADLRKGRRPSWTGAEDPAAATECVEAFARALEARGIRVARGVFGAHMQVELVNDGPVTIWLDADAS